MCIYSKSKITTYAVRLSVFCFQNRLITEPVQDKGGQFAADLCFVFIYFVFQHQLLKEAGESWQALVKFAFVYKLLSLKYHWVKDRVSFDAYFCSKQHKILCKFYMDKKVSFTFFFQCCFQRSPKTSDTSTFPKHMFNAIFFVIAEATLSVSSDSYFV